jgi:hypothetical protein
MGRRGAGQGEGGIKSTWNSTTEGELHVVEKVDIKSGNGGGRRRAVCVLRGESEQAWVSRGEGRARFSIDHREVNGSSNEKAVGANSIGVTFLIVTFLITMRDT